MIQLILQVKLQQESSQEYFLVSGSPYSGDLQSPQSCSAINDIHLSWGERRGERELTMFNFTWLTLLLLENSDGWEISRIFCFLKSLIIFVLGKQFVRKNHAPYVT